MTEIRRTLKRYEEPNHVRYLTCSCYDRLPLFKNDQIKDAFVEQLSLARKRLNFQLYAWVIMPEHFHLLLTPDLPKSTVTKVLYALKPPFATKVITRWRQLDAKILERVRDAQGNPHFWLEGGGYDRNIVSKEELFEKLAYIHNNPIKRGLVERAAEWRWSSAAWYERREGLPMAPLPI
jgi:putative transposase